MYRLERTAIDQVDVVIACSERDRLKYVEMGAKKSVYYPNIYPIEEFEPSVKDQLPSIVIVSRGHWDLKAEKSLEEIFKALSVSGRNIKVIVIGVKPKKVSKNVRLQHYEFIPGKMDYLNVLSESWIGINIGFHMAGSNERKYDYAMAGLVVFSDSMGTRGDLLPNEYTYVDSQDLAAKLGQLLQFGKDRIVEMGGQNRDQALSLAKKQREILLRTVNDLVMHES
jgi:glycosyltransferase involved in cell wall biosynthesis